MKVLLDHCVPKSFGFLLSGHYVRAAKFMGWGDLQNGKLLAAAASQFGACVTVDTNIEFQQHMPDLPLPVLVLVAPTNTIEDLTALAPRTLAVLATPLEKRIYIIRLTDGDDPSKR